MLHQSDISICRPERLCAMHVATTRTHTKLSCTAVYPAVCSPSSHRSAAAVYASHLQVVVRSLQEANRTQLLNNNITVIVPPPLALQAEASGQEYNTTGGCHEVGRCVLCLHTMCQCAGGPCVCVCEW